MEKEEEQKAGFGMTFVTSRSVPQFPCDSGFLEQDPVNSSLAPYRGFLSLS